ncbi:hypothetical protein FACS1894191_8540 [Clostridia bacterium]|nr:hypothetical protein FACS1894191_8540 [Clostridia bacterium]
MAAVKPHKLVKEEPFVVSFRSDIPAGGPGGEIDCLCARKTVLLPAAVLFCGAVFFLLLALHESPAYAVGCLLAIPAAAFLNSATERVIICENAVIKKSRLRENVFYLRDISRLESYNIISAWSFRGVSYGYRFMRGEEVLFAMKVDAYADLERIEGLFEEWKDVRHERDML